MASHGLGSAGLGCSWHEELLIHPLVSSASSASSSSTVFARFHFSASQSSSSSSSSASSTKENSNECMPMDVLQILTYSNATEFRTSLASGRWTQPLGDAADVDPVANAALADAARPRGSELYAKFDDGNNTYNNERFASLAHALGGMLSADFGTAAATHGEPRIMVAPATFHIGNQTKRNANCKYGAVPSEFACTENLSRALRLLPGGGAHVAGLRTLLRPREFVAADAYGVHLAARKEQGRIHVSVTYDVVLSNVKGWNDKDDDLASLLRAAFNAKDIPKAPSTAQTSVIWMHGVAHALNDTSLTPNKHLDASVHHTRIPALRAYRSIVPASRNTARGWGGSLARPFASLGHAGVGRSALAIDVVREVKYTGGKAVITCFHQRLPSAVQPYFHTLDARALLKNGSEAPADTAKLTEISAMPVPPARGGGWTLEFCLRLTSPWSTARVTLDVEERHLHIDEHPPDANRGVDLPAAAYCSVVDDDDATTQRTDAPTPLMALLQSRTGGPLCHGHYADNGVLVFLPVPDMSMPYNVICFTSTVASMFVTMALSTLLKRREEIKLAEQRRKLGLREPSSMTVVARKLIRQVVRLIRGNEAASKLTKPDELVKISKLDGKLPLLFIGLGGAYVASVGVDKAEGELRRVFRKFG